MLNPCKTQRLLAWARTTVATRSTAKAGVTIEAGFKTRTEIKTAAMAAAAEANKIVGDAADAMAAVKTKTQATNRKKGAARVKIDFNPGFVDATTVVVPVVAGAGSNPESITKVAAQAEVSPNPPQQSPSPQHPRIQEVARTLLKRLKSIVKS